MGARTRREAELAWASLAGQHNSLLFMDRFSGMERIAVLAGFAPRGLTGFTPPQRVIGRLLRESAEAIPALSLEKLTSRSDQVLAALRHGDDGGVSVCPEAVPASAGPASTASESWPFFFHSTAGRLCELLVPTLLAGHGHAEAKLEPRSACLRAACGVFWTLEREHYGPAQAPLLARALIEALELPAPDEHVLLVEGVLAGCGEERLLELLRPPDGEAAAWRFSSDYRTCVWGSKTFYFTETQSRIIAALHQERHETGCGLGLGELCMRAKLGSARPSGVTEGGIIRHHFHESRGTHPCWGTMLQKPRRDLFELVPPPAD